MTLKTDINTGAITEVLNNKVDLVPNIPQDAIDYVIDYYPKTEEERSQANGNWYRIYKSGWIEQGGIFDNGSYVKDLVGKELIFLKKFSNVNYQIFATPFRTDRDNEENGLCTAMIGFYALKTNSAKIRWYIQASYNELLRFANWYAIGWGI